MKNTFYVLMLLLIVASCQKPNKIGYVNNGDIVKDYQEAKDLDAKYKAKEDAFKKKTDSISQAFQLEAQKEQLEAQKLAQRGKRKQAEDIMVALQQKQGVLQQTVQFEQQQLTQAAQTESDSLIIKIKDFIKDYGKKNGYTFILGTSDGASSVIYGEDQTNLTQTILDALNSDYKKD
ncbi:MAG: OmpH family outer membrane protein [Jejuia sp.]